MNYYFDTLDDTVDYQLIADIEKSIHGEYSAILCYEQLAKMTSCEEKKKQILEIRDDEIKHYHTFTKIYYRLTGEKIRPQITEPCPKNFRDGLKFAIQDEQETVDFYLDIADRSKDRYIKRKYKRAAADEQNHAVWFLFYYTQLCCHS